MKIFSKIYITHEQLVHILQDRVRTESDVIIPDNVSIAVSTYDENRCVLDTNSELEISWETGKGD